MKKSSKTPKLGIGLYSVADPPRLFASGLEELAADLRGRAGSLSEILTSFSDKETGHFVRYFGRMG